MSLNIKHPFTKLYDNDKDVYFDMVDIESTPQNKLTVRDVTNRINTILMTKSMHKTTRVKLKELINGKINRDTIKQFLDNYESRIIAISPDPLPNESVADYAERTNIPASIVRLKFECSGLLSD